MTTKSTQQHKFTGFDGFSTPNTTPVPDVFFDVLAPALKEAELRVLLYIIRRTYGFKKAADSISLRQMVDGIVKRDGQVLDRGTGLSKSGVTKALRALLDMGIIIHNHNSSPERGNEPTTYALRFKIPLSTGEDKGVSTGVDKPLSAPVDTQETVLQSNSSTVEDENNRIERERNESQPILVGQAPVTTAMTDTAPPLVSRRASSVSPIGQVLQQRVETLARRRSLMPAAKRHPKALHRPCRRKWWQG
jgi:hypothetical protein